MTRLDRRFRPALPETTALRSTGRWPGLASWVLSGILLMGLTSALAAQRSLVIERFDATIEVNRDGTISVTETIMPRFSGSWNGIFRTIPVVYRNAQGFNWTIRLDQISATDGQGNPLRMERSRERHYVKLKVWVPGAQDATRTVVLRYRASNALRFFDEHDELYWNVTGDEWEQPIEAATAVVTLPAGVQGVRAIAFDGVYGSTAQNAQVGAEDRTVRVALPEGRTLGFGEGLTVVVGWDPLGFPPGTSGGAAATPERLVERPTATTKSVGFLAANWPLAIPIPVFFLMLNIWRRKGKDPEDLPVVVRYQPPDGMTPGEAGTLLDASPDMKDITATIVDLAVRDYLRIEERKKAVLFGLWNTEEIVFLRGNGNLSALAPHERKVFDGIFDSGEDEVALEDLENEFYTTLPKVQQELWNGLIKRGHYKSRPDKVAGLWVGGGVVLGFAIGIAGSVLAEPMLLTPVPFILAGILTGLVVVGFGIVMPARTVKGARVREQIQGFEEFLRRVEKERYRDVQLTPEMFERFLPWAMAFGVEKKWARAFDGMYLEPPRWYVGTDLRGFNASTFSARMGSVATRMGTTMSSSPRSSSGSGFGGGGSSGGGGGGGGGGGF